MKKIAALLVAVVAAVAVVAPVAASGSSPRPPYPFDPNYPTVTVVPNPVTPNTSFKAEARYFCPKVNVVFVLRNSSGTALQMSKPIAASSAGFASVQFKGVPIGTYTVQAKQNKPLSGSLAKTCKMNISVTTTLIVEPDTTPPVAPPGFAAQALSSTSIKLTWNASSPDTAKYRIERSPNGSSSWTTLTTITLPATLTYTHTGLTPSTTYYYRIVAIDAANNTSTPSSASATTSAQTGIVVTAVGSIASKKKVATLTWTGNTGKVDIYRTVSSKLSSIAKGVSGSQYIDSSVSSSTKSALYHVCPAGVKLPSSQCGSATATWS